jgi:hypothetical protein
MPGARAASISIERLLKKRLEQKMVGRKLERAAS